MPLSRNLALVRRVVKGRARANRVGLLAYAARDKHSRTIYPSARMKHRGIGRVMCAFMLATHAARAQSEEVLLDGRDHYTLLDRHLVNRQLLLQLDSDAQAFRLGKDWERFG